MISTDFLYRLARDASVRRRQRFAEEPSASLQSILDSPEQRSLRKLIFLCGYVYLAGALLRIRVLINSLADRDTPARRRRIARLKLLLAGQLSASSRISETTIERDYFSRDIAVVPRLMLKLLYRSTPLLVVQPAAVEDIKQLFLFADKHRLSVTVRGASSSAFGAVIPTRNGLVLDLSRLKRIIAVDRERLLATVEPGIRWSELDAYLRPYGLCTPVHPSSRFSTVGGWLSTGGIGLHAYKFGPLSCQVAAAAVLHPNGQQSKLADPQAMRLFMGAEAQLGVFTEATLRLRPLPESSSPALLSFASIDAAFEFLNLLSHSDLAPSHAVVFDRARMAEENLLFSDRTGRSEQIVAERDAVLLHFDDLSEQQRFLRQTADSSDLQVEPESSARYLWEERFFPLKAQRLGPNLLAAELFVPDINSLPDLNRELQNLARRFGIHGALEFISAKEHGNACGVLIFSFAADSKRRLSYLFSLLFVQLAVFRCLQLGARPYGFGIWNAPFFGIAAAESDQLELARLKRQFDPRKMLNPGKFFAVQGRFAGLSSLFFHRCFLIPILRSALLLSRSLGLCSRGLARRDPNLRWAIPSPVERQGRTLLEQAAQRCTFCGACVSVCPAYQLTGDELTTGRGKLFLASRLLRGEASTAEEHFRPFQCLRCRLCEEVCQTRLPLVECYERLEELTSTRFGRFPSELVAAFLHLADQKRSWLLEIFGLDSAQWAPPDMSSVIPNVRSDLRTDHTALIKQRLSSRSSGGAQ